MAKAPSSWTRVVVPDSHGCFIDPQAAAAFLRDLAVLDPREIVMLGDHVDVGGMFSVHPPTYILDMGYSYEKDCEEANLFLDEIQANAPRAEIHYLEGNHEQHIERWAARNVRHERDAKAHAEAMGPYSKLRLKERRIKYYPMHSNHMGLSVRGTIKLGKCYYTHGFTASQFATHRHLVKYGANIVHGHTHRAQEYRTNIVAAGTIGAWCPGTLAMRFPYYHHTNPGEHTHGYGLELVKRNGMFLHINVPIIDGESLLPGLLKGL